MAYSTPTPTRTAEPVLTSTTTTDVLTPCIGVCEIDTATGLCTGCLRSVREIGAWSRLDNDARARIMATLPERGTPRTSKDT